MVREILVAVILLFGNCVAVVAAWPPIELAGAWQVEQISGDLELTPDRVTNSVLLLFVEDRLAVFQAVEVDGARFPPTATSWKLSDGGKVESAFHVTRHRGKTNKDRLEIRIDRIESELYRLSIVELESEDDLELPAGLFPDLPIGTESRLRSFDVRRLKKRVSCKRITEYLNTPNFKCEQELRDIIARFAAGIQNRLKADEPSDAPKDRTSRVDN